MATKYDTINLPAMAQFEDLQRLVPVLTALLVVAVSYLVYNVCTVRIECAFLAHSSASPNCPAMY